MRMRYLLFTLLAFVAVPAAKATCNPVPFNFSLVESVYDSGSTGGNPPTTTYHKITYSGTSQMAPNCVPSARHYAKVYNVLNGVGGWTTGAQVCTNCFTTATSTLGIPFFEDNNDVANSGAEADCTFAGPFINVVIYGLRFHTKKTKFHTTGRNFSVAHAWYQEPWCDPETMPPDVIPDYVIDPRAEAPADYYENYTFCWRKANAPSGTAWTCRNSEATITSTTSLKPFCTKYDAGQNGFPFNWYELGQQQALGWVIRIFKSIWLP